MRVREVDSLTQSVRGRERLEDGGSKKAAPAGALGGLRSIAVTLGSRWKLLLPLWLAISAVLVALVFALPQGYQRTFDLSVTPAQTELQASVGQPAPEPTQASNQAINFLQQTNFGPVTVDPKYDSTKQQIEVRAKSEDREALNKVSSKAVASVEYGFRTTYEASLGSSIRTQLASTRQQVGALRATLKDIEGQIADTKPKGPEDVEAIVKLTVLESKRQDVLNEISSQEDEISYFQGALKDLPQLAEKPVAVKASNVSDIRHGRSRVPAAFFAVLLGFVIAAAAVLRFAAARSK
jgi:hypothetical protein